jgi:pimeloyl-ACP methyl ester carboxylesterase
MIHNPRHKVGEHCGLRPVAIKPTIVFTPHFGGDISSIRRHQEFFSKLGYKTAFVPYEFGPQKNAPRTIFYMKAGVTGLWLSQLTSVLDKITGPKIIFSFSFPSCIVFQLMAEVPRSDVKAWITDGGPFLWPWLGISNYFKYTRRDLPQWKISAAGAFGFVVLGGPLYMWRINRWVRKMPRAFPILSIRAGKDALVPEASIEALFALNKDLNVKVLRIPEAEHMLGLKSFPEIYKPPLEQFLSTVSITE